jgi:hypothetical protein
MISCEKTMENVQPFQTENEENFRLKDSIVDPTPNGGDDDNSDGVIIDP